MTPDPTGGPGLDLAEVPGAPEPGAPESGAPEPAAAALRRRHNPRRVGLCVLLLGLSTSLALAVVMGDVVRRSQRSLLLTQAAISGSALGALMGQIQSSLDAVGMVAVASLGRPEAIERASSLPSMSRFSSLVLLVRQGPAGGTGGGPAGDSAGDSAGSPGWVPSTTVRPATASLADITSPVVKALQAAPPDQLDVLGLLGSGSARTVALADRPTGAPDYLIYAEVPLAAASPRSASSTRSQPLQDLDFAFYLHDAEQPGDLVFTSAPHLPLRGPRAVIHLAPGNPASPTILLSTRPGDTKGQPGDLLMVFAAKGSLGGALAGDVAWICLAVGAALSCLAAAGFAMLLRSRNRAVDLVCQMQASNEARDRALAERMEAERHRGRLEAQLRQAQRLEAVGQLAGGIAHDFNNLLAVILNFGHFVMEAVRGHPAEGDVEEMLRAAQQAADLTRQLLIFSRQDVVRPEAVDLNGVIAATSRLLGRTLGEHIELQLHLDQELPRVEADIGGLEQVLMNLAVNARDAMPEGGRLTLATSVADVDDSYAETHAGSSPGRHVLLEVSDTGCGMTPEVSLRIFEPFFTTKPAGVGTGMGLSTVYGIVSRWGGHISVYSEVGLGTVFKIWLPVMAAPARERVPVEAQIPEHGGGRRVLLVEDAPAVRRAARRILEGGGYRVAEAANGPEALAAFRREVPDVVVSDVVMPGGMSGKALVDEFRATVPELPVLFMSGYTADIITARGVLEPNVLLIQKPFSAQILLDAVRRALLGDAVTAGSDGNASPAS